MVDKFIEARKHWVEDPSLVSFEEDAAFYQINGLSFSWGNNLLLARPVDLNHPELWKTHTVFDPKACQAWFVCYACGEIQTLLRMVGNLVPEYPYIVMEHREKLACLPFQKIRRIFDGKK